MSELELKLWAEEYVSVKAEADKYKKLSDNLNDNIKRGMELLGKEEVELADGSRVCYGITKRESIDEEKLIAQLHKYAPDTQCIKTKEYIDMEVLENELYKGDFSQDAMTAMDKCRIIKEIPTLNIRKSKTRD